MSVVLLGHYPAAAQEGGGAPGPKTEVEVHLTESFYRALAAEDGKTLRTNRSEEYLRRIAVASRFMVESNLKVIENQRRIIELLESMHKPKEK